MNIENGYETEDKMLLKVFFIIIGILALTFSSFLVYYSFTNDKTKKESVKDTLKEPLTNYEITSIIELNDGYILCETKDNKLILNNEGKLIEQIDKNTDVNLIYDGYYAIKKSSYNEIKREGETVVKETTDTITKTFKENNSNTYIISTKLSNNSKVNILSNDIAYLNIYSNKTSILYNYKTGKVILENSGLIETVYINEELSTNIIAIKSNDDIKLYNIKEEKYMFTDKTYKLTNESYQVNNESIYFNNSKYIVVNEQNKYGVIDYNGEIIIPTLYDMISIDSNNELYIAAKLEQDYFLIDIVNKVMLPFKYNYIKVVNNYIVVKDNDKLNIFDSRLNRINKDSFTINESTPVENIEIKVYKRILKVNINNDTNDTNYKEIIVTPSNEIIASTKNENNIFFIENKYSEAYYLIYNNYKLDVYDKDSVYIGSIKDIKELYSKKIYSNNNEIYINDNIVYSTLESKVTKTNEEGKKYIEEQISFLNSSNIVEYDYSFDGANIKLKTGENTSESVEGNAIIELNNGYFIVRDNTNIWKIYKLI